MTSGSRTRRSSCWRPPPNARPDFFAGIPIAAKHVDFHLTPIYTDPGLLDGISPGLRKRLKGKTTFNFTVLDNALFTELAALTARSFDAYVAIDP